jgi:glycosyltransferase involved in cell wall biosynthesis
MINLLMKKKAAHFLLIPELMYSPPNRAIVNGYLEQGYLVDIFAPGLPDTPTLYGERIQTFSVSYTWIWLLRNIMSLRWFQYSCFSGTSEDPLAVVGIISLIYRSHSFCLVDEIKAGNYRGDRSEWWKRLCKWAIRKSEFQIVNDNNRIQLLKEYAGLPTDRNIIVYPGCFYEKPNISSKNRSEIRRGWGFTDDNFVIGSSGGFNMTAGADWLLNSVSEFSDLYAVIQPLGVSPLSLFLLGSLGFCNRIFVESRRLDWDEAWFMAQGLDIGVCIYTNKAPQFQMMGISSNRLCMFIAMGVPVIASKQDSFSFLEDFDCGVLVSNYTEFKEAIREIRSRGAIMRKNCGVCFKEYIRPGEYYRVLSESIRTLHTS